MINHLWPALLVALHLTQGCTSSLSLPDHPIVGAQREEKRASIRLAWSINSGNLVSDLALSRTGQVAAVALVPDPDREKGDARFQVWTIQKNGSITSKKTLRSKVKSLQIAAPNLVFVSTYDGKLRALGDGPLWEVDRLCKITLLDDLKQLLCAFDDESQPAVAFELYDFDGRLTYAHPATGAVLGVKASGDGRNIVLAQAGGWIELVRGGKTLWKTKVPGEVVDLDVSLGDSPRVVALYNQGNQGKGRGHHALAALDSEGRLRETLAIQNAFEQIALNTTGEWLALYGNGPDGQLVSYFQVKGLNSQWLYREPRFSDFSSRLILAENQVLAGLEDTDEKGLRHSHLYHFNLMGKVDWDLGLKTSEGGFLYVYALQSGEKKQYLVTATDEGQIRGYWIKD